MDFQGLFKIGLDRPLPGLFEPHPGPAFDLGASGKKVARGAIGLGLPNWSFPRDPIPCDDGKASIIHAYHFMEHLPGETAIILLKEVQRALMVGGLFQFCIPYAKAEIAFKDLTHKSFWTESSFRMLMNNPYYDPTAADFKWRLRVHFQVIAGIVERNLCLMGQLVKE
jgi:hypothetical protein